MKRRISLPAALGLWFHRALAELPPELRERVKRRFGFPWDDLTIEQRRIVARQIDAQFPEDPLEYEKYKIELAVRAGYKKISVPRRNWRNSKRPRPARQMVSDQDILRLKQDLDAEGVSPEKQCSVAYRRWSATAASPITLRSFRRRWNHPRLKRRRGR